MKNPLVSVIVPIYGIQSYIGICIESLLNQSYKNIEIILVDDGSPDRSGEICDLYARKDDRITVIHKQNGGLVSARQAGLNVAKGEYIGYVDGDDWVGKDFYNRLVDSAVLYGADLVVAGMSRDLFDSSVKIESNIPCGYYCDRRLDDLKRNMMQFGGFSRVGITTYVWNKLFKKDILKKHQNSVDTAITIGEDAAVTYPYILDCNSVCVIDNCEYHYRQREDSMLKKSKSYSEETIGLRKLYLHLSKAMADFDKQYNTVCQITDFLLGICIMRSGGIFNGNEIAFPFSQDFKGKNIAIFSAGTFGQQMVNRIKDNHYCNIAGWFDNDYNEYRRCCLDVDPIEKIDFTDFDYAVIATVDSVYAQGITQKLVWRGISADKILSINCRVDHKTLLDMYLDPAETEDNNSGICK